MKQTLNLVILSFIVLLFACSQKKSNEEILQTVKTDTVQVSGEKPQNVFPGKVKMEKTINYGNYLPNIGLLANYGYTQGLNKVRAAKAKQQIMLLQRDNLNKKMNLEMTQVWMEMINAKIGQQLNEVYYLKATEGL